MKSLCKTIIFALAATLPLFAGYPDNDQQAINPCIRLDQQAILDNKVSFRTLQEVGRHLFVTPFSRQDGHGEGIDGVMGSTGDGDRVAAIRERSQQLGDGLYGFPTMQFLRLNGLDSQSCFECHNTIGVANQADTGGLAFSRKVNVTGGPAGFASNAFINPLITKPLDKKIADAVDMMLGESNNSVLSVRFNREANATNREQSIQEIRTGFIKRMTLLVRNPPHVFGTGYVQKLAQEMSRDLVKQRDAAFGKFVSDAVTNQNEDHQTSFMLASKGVQFGTLSYSWKKVKDKALETAAITRRDTVSYVSTKICGSYSIKIPLQDGLYQVTEHCEGIAGVSDDFIVRPLQWKGIASNERNFVRDAANFHFGMQAEELFPPELDCDKDGKQTELTVGDVTALTLFTVSIRPPIQVEPNPGKKTMVDLGRKLFMDEERLGCVMCHMPSMQISDTTLEIRNPKREEKCPQSATLSTPLDDLPLDTTQIAYYTFDLSMKDVNPLALSFPRLEENEDGSVDVPLFSDLKRHFMGSGLADPIAQMTDRNPIGVKREKFLTRPLWGVADTGPWLHDGRATTLKDAILAHASDPAKDKSLGLMSSEANGVIAKYEHDLTSYEQEAVIEFLKTLRLPFDPRYGVDNKN